MNLRDARQIELLKLKKGKLQSIRKSLKDDVNYSESANDDLRENRYHIECVNRKIKKLKGG